MSEITLPPLTMSLSYRSKPRQYSETLRGQSELRNTFVEEASAVTSSEETVVYGEEEVLLSDVTASPS